MVEKSLPASRHFKLPQLSVDTPEHLHPAEKFRARRRIVRGLLKYRALNAEMMLFYHGPVGFNRPEPFFGILFDTKIGE